MNSSRKLRNARQQIVRHDLEVGLALLEQLREQQPFDASERVIGDDDQRALRALSKRSVTAPHRDVRCGLTLPARVPACASALTR